MRTQTKGIRPLDFLAERCDCLSKFSKKEGRGPGGGGGYSVWKRVPSAVRPLESGGCRDPRQLKKGGLSSYYIVR